MQDTAPANPAAAEPTGPTPRHATKRPRWFWPLIVTLVVVASVGFYAFVIYPQPVITLTNFSYFATDCYRYGNSSQENYTYYVTLVNSGSADGSALVWFLVDGNFAVYFYRYPVPHGTSQRIIYTEDWPDCNAHTPSAAITDVAKTW